MPGPLQLVAPPVALPQPFGLLEVAGPPVGDDDLHWQQGIFYQALCPLGGTTWEECLAVTGIGAAPPPPSKADNADLVLRAATPFTVYAEFDCSAVGLPDLEQLAEQALVRVEGWQVERAFWTGFAGPAGSQQPVVYPHLAEDVAVTYPLGYGPGSVATLTSAATVVSGGNPAVALGSLEQALTDCYRGQGVVHAPLAAVATLYGNRLIERQGARLVTAAGTPVVAGGGYPGTSPAGAAPAAGTTWLYATGRPFYRRSPARSWPLRDSFNRAENTVAMLAERTYLLGWDCCHFAAPLTLGSV